MKSLPRNSIARTSIAAVAGAATLTALVGCAPPAGDSEVMTTLTVAANQLYVTNWDPIQGGIGGDEVTWQSVFDTLVVWDSDAGTYLPRLAEEISLSDDRMTMTFALRDDVVFADGVRMDAAGVEKFYDAVLESDQYAYAGLIAGYEPEFTATGEYTLEMSTAKPIYPADFRVLLGRGTPVLSPAAVDDPERAIVEPLGSGPYLLEEVVPDAEATFVRNPDYWNPDAYPFDTIVVTVLADPVAKLNALKSGQVDIAPLTLEQVAEAEASGLALHEGGGSYAVVFVRDAKNSAIPALSDVRVREAIAIAFDRAAIAESIDLGYGIVSSQAFIPSQPEYIAGADERFAYDADRARELMAEAGYADGFDVTIPVWQGASSLQPLIETALGEIGIRVTYESIADYLEWFEAITSGDYPLIVEPGARNTNTLRYLSEETPFGRFLERDDEIIELVRVIKEGTPEESAAASQELGAKILDEVLFIPISRPATFWASVPEVTAYVTQSDGTVNLRDIQRAN